MGEMFLFVAQTLFVFFGDARLGRLFRSDDSDGPWIWGRQAEEAV